MNDTAARILAALDARNKNITATAADLGISKQAYSLARQRGSISADLAVRAAALLRLDPAQTLLALHRDDASTPETRAAWESALDRLTPLPETGKERADNSDNNTGNDTSNGPRDTFHNVSRNTNYATFDDGKIHGMPPIKTRRIERAEKLVLWMLCVPRMSTTSPRFAYYAKHWNVLAKIERFEKSGELAEAIADAPAFSAAELRAALDYLDQHDKDEATKTERIVTSRPAARQLESA